MIFTTIREIRHHINDEKKKGRKIGLVPTMGYLHEGHLSLIRQAKERGNYVVLSIFVNPLQFGPNEDYARYPRDLKRDEKLADEAGVDAIFAPSVEEMYPEKSLTYVTVEKLSDTLCGLIRPGHFRGVATVVSKLFHIIEPDEAFFGQKDIQQVRIIEQMVTDLNFPIKVVRCPIIREEDGLAMSSRNVYLSPAERREAPILYKALRRAEKAFLNGEIDGNTLVHLVKEQIEQAPSAKIEYVSLVHLKTLDEVTKVTEPAILAIAVRFGTTRLIDNILLEPSQNAHYMHKHEGEHGGA